MNTELHNEWANIRPSLGNLICHIDGKLESLEAEEKRISERRDESYWQGVQDFYEAIKVFAVGIYNGGMSIQEIREYFDAPYISDILSIGDILSKYDPKTIMEKVNEWKADKNRAEEEFRVGDEVIIGMSPVSAPNELLKGIVININDNELLGVRIPDSKTECPGYNIRWTYKKNARKTGQHFDGIPFSYFDKGETNA